MNKSFIDIFKKDKMADFYNIKDICLNGDIVIGEDTISVFEIEPINIINIKSEELERILALYKGFLKKIDNEFQVYISSHVSNLNQEILLNNKYIESSYSVNFKEAIKQYSNYLSDVSQKEKIYSTRYFIVLKNIGFLENNIKHFFSELIEIGLNVKKIKEQEKIKKLLKASITKCENVFF